MGKKYDWQDSILLIKGKLRFLKDYEDILKKAALPAVVAVAVLCFWIFGGDSPDKQEVSINVNGPASEAEEVRDEDALIYVDIGGEVQNPGVYQIPEGTRLFQVIEEAGGLKETAAADSINQAEPVIDGQKIIVGSLDAASPYYIGSSVISSTSGQDRNISESKGAVRITADGVLVNINLATLEDLQVIPGVGPSTAQKILDYRNANGPFQKPEDLKKISGIGEKTYENLKDFIEI